MFSELVPDADKYSRPFPIFGRPKIIGYMSLDSKREYHADTRQLMFAKEIKDSGAVHFDLNLHLDKVERKPLHLNERINHLLQFLVDQEKRLDLKFCKDLDSAAFLCYRGLMTCVACTPYENREPWRIVATLYKGDIYLCARDTQDKTNRLNHMTDNEMKFGSWGYKFEQYVLSDSPNSEPNPNQGVNESEEFSLVLTTKLGKHTIYYGAEMDGIRCDKGNISNPPSSEMGMEPVIKYLSDKEFIELKTNRHLEFPNQHKNFRRFKTKKWWCQSFLAGVDSVLCGFRNDDGIVEELKVFSVKDLTKLSERFWKPNVCFSFLETFFTFVKRCLSKEIRRRYGDDAINNLDKVPLTHLHFEWEPRMPVRVTNEYCYESDPILPQWFIDSYKKRSL